MSKKSTILSQIKNNTYLGGLKPSQTKKLLSDIVELSTIPGSYANDAAAAAATPAVAIGEMYHTSGAVKVRLS